MFTRVDLVPLTVGAPSQRELDVAEAKGVQPPQPWSVATIDDVVADTIREYPGGPTISSARNFMEMNSDYRGWQDSMPKLKDVPNLHKYRNSKKTAAILQGAEKEIQAHGDTLDADQFIFRGSGHKTMPANTPISTSMLPSVAVRFAIDTKGEVWVLRVSDPNVVRAFCFSTRSNQKNNMEMELLLEANLKIAQNKPSQTIVCGKPGYKKVPINVLFYDLFK